MRPLLFRLAAATAVLLAATGCVSLPAGGSGHGPGTTPGGRTVAPARPSPLLMPTEKSTRERLVEVASARHKPGRQRKVPKKAAPRGHAAAVNVLARRTGRAMPHHPRSAPPRARTRTQPVRTVPRQRHHAGAQARALPRPPRRGATVDPGVVCRMASGRVRADLVQLCHRTYGR
ncbi:hypothetical protein [Streptomyces auratus]|uniref:Lipoprotein n=1 Tax=Streptomyces auratus AGR0001 TaxID=1160718 RepID=A0A8B1PHE5_9ACTN|nr:hypothetical protein [Streptomyces auratus]QTZ95611.1 hypothetical protein SU9_032605 [Streptomyces auratus AGR0001]